MDVYLPFLTKAMNRTTTENIFAEQLKKFKVIPLCKKEDSFKGEL